MLYFNLTIFVFTIGLLAILVLALSIRNRKNIKSINYRVKESFLASISVCIAFNLISLFYIFMWDLKAERLIDICHLIFAVSCIVYIANLCILMKFQSEKVISLNYCCMFLYVILLAVCVYIPSKDSTYDLKGDAYEYQVSTVDCYSGLFGEDLGDIQVYYNNKGLKLFQADDALSIISKGYKDAKFKEDDIKYILAEDIYWSYNGVSYIPLEELNSLDSGLVKINITYENGELKEFIPESIELTVLNKDTVYCKATDGYATVSTAFNVK